MPFVDFENIDTHEVIEIWFQPNEERVYNGPNGDEVGKWKKLMGNPYMAVSSSTRISATNPKSFHAAMENKKGLTMGQMWEQSAELSAKRAGVSGQDEVKQKYYDSYKQKTGKEHPQKSKEDAGKKAKELSKAILSA